MDGTPVRALAEFTEALASAGDIHHLRRLLAAHSRTLLEVAGVDVLVSDHGVIASSGSPDQPEFAALFDLHSRFGPGHECFRYGRPVAITLAGAHCLGWPSLAAAMANAGVAVADAVPLGVRQRTVGALTVFRTEIDPGSAERRFGRLVMGLANLSVENMISAERVKRLSFQLDGDRDHRSG